MRKNLLFANFRKGEKDKEEDKDLVEKADLETNVKMINPADTMNLWTR